MPKTWRGPSAELKAARTNPLFAAVARHAGRQGISFFDEENEHGCSIMVRRVYQASGRCGTWFYDDLGRVTGPDPLSTMLQASHAYAESDPELFALHHQYVAGELEKAAGELASLVAGLGHAVDEFLVIFE